MPKGLFKKALGAFVDFSEEKEEKIVVAPVDPGAVPVSPYKPITRPRMSEEDMDKFEAHFNQLFDKANLPGPDYYELSKVMDQLETAIPDERTRLHAAFASLAVQGLTKDVVVSSAGHYIEAINQDRAKFQTAAQTKFTNEIAGRKQEISDKEKYILQIQQQIQELTRQLMDAQSSIQVLKDDMTETEAAIKKNEESYLFACNAMVDKIQNDIQKIQTIL